MGIDDGRMLVLDYPSMRIGGIETYFSNLIVHAVNNGIRVVWLTTEADEEASDYAITKDSRVEKAYVKKTPFGPLYPRIDFKQDDKVVVLTCEPLQYILSDKYKRAKGVSINHFFLLPNTTGNMYYPERFAKLRPFRILCKKKFGELAFILNQGECIFAFSQKHLDSYEDNYGITVSNKAARTLPPSAPPSDVDAGELSERARSREDGFVIISCARFDFPHKGYLVGLVREFAQLKKEFPSIKLRIVGYGEGEDRLNAEIKKLDKDAQESIALLGKLSPSELKQAYRKAHLNVGVAGALRIGAGEGLPSIIMRQHSYECECYGLFEEGNEDTIRDCPGESPLELISDIVRASDSEYMEFARRSFDLANKEGKPDCDFFFRQSETLARRVSSLDGRIKARLFYMYTYIKRKLFKMYGY